MLGRQDQKLETVKHQTNRNLTRAENRAEAAEAKAEALQEELGKLGP